MKVNNTATIFGVAALLMQRSFGSPVVVQMAVPVTPSYTESSKQIVAQHEATSPDLAAATRMMLDGETTREGNEAADGRLKEAMQSMLQAEDVKTTGVDGSNVAAAASTEMTSNASAAPVQHVNSSSSSVGNPAGQQSITEPSLGQLDPTISQAIQNAPRDATKDVHQPDQSGGQINPVANSDGQSRPVNQEPPLSAQNNEAGSSLEGASATAQPKGNQSTAHSKENQSTVQSMENHSNAQAMENSSTAQATQPNTFAQSMENQPGSLQQQPKTTASSSSMLGKMGRFAGAVLADVAPDISYGIRRGLFGHHAHAHPPPVHRMHHHVPLPPTGTAADYLSLMGSMRAPPNPHYNVPPYHVRSPPMPVQMPPPPPPPPMPAKMPPPMPHSHFVPNYPVSMPPKMMPNMLGDEDDDEFAFQDTPRPPLPPMPPSSQFAGELRPREKRMHCFCEGSASALDAKLHSMGLETGRAEMAAESVPRFPVSSAGPGGPFSRGSGDAEAETEAVAGRAAEGPFWSTSPQQPTFQSTPPQQPTFQSTPSQQPTFQSTGPSQALNSAKGAFSSFLSNLLAAWEKLKLWFADERHPVFSYPRISLTDNPPPPPKGVRGRVDDYGYSL